MDKEFMKFWGTFFLSAAKGQQQFEDMVKWLQGNVTSSNEVTELFTKFYGVDAFMRNTPEYLKLWNVALLDFQKSFQEFLSLMNLVPQDDLAKTMKENEELKSQVRSLEKRIEDLQQLITEKSSLEESGLKGFQALMSEQTRQFQEMIKGYSKAFIEESSPGEGVEPLSGGSKSEVPGRKTPKKKSRVNNKKSRES